MEYCSEHTWLHSTGSVWKHTYTYRNAVCVCFCCPGPINYLPLDLFSLFEFILGVYKSHCWVFSLHKDKLREKQQTCSAKTLQIHHFASAVTDWWGREERHQTFFLCRKTGPRFGFVQVVVRLVVKWLSHLLCIWRQTPLSIIPQSSAQFAYRFLFMMAECTFYQRWCCRVRWFVKWIEEVLHQKTQSLTE